MAAGYYSARVTGAGGDLGAVEMVLRSDTEVLSIGGARFFRPATSVVQRLADDTVVLDRGVAWVAGAAGSAVRLRVGAFLLQSEDADYSLESLPGAMPRCRSARRGSGRFCMGTPPGRDGRTDLALNGESRGPSICCRWGLSCEASQARFRPFCSHLRPPTARRGESNRWCRHGSGVHAAAY